MLPGSVHQIWLCSAAESVTHGNEQPWSRPRRELRHLILHVPQEPSQSLKERQRGALPTTRRGICPPPPAPPADALSSRFCHSFLHDSNPQGAVLHGGQSLRPAASSGEERVMDDPCQGPIPVCVTPLLAARDSPQQEASPQDLACASTALHGSEPRAQEQYVVPTDTSRDTSPTRLWPQSRPRAPATPARPQAPPPQQRGTKAGSPAEAGVSCSNRQHSQPWRETVPLPTGKVPQEDSSGAAGGGSCQAHGAFRGGAPPGWAHDGADSSWNRWWFEGSHVGMVQPPSRRERPQEASRRWRGQ